MKGEKEEVKRKGKGTGRKGEGREEGKKEEKR